MEAHAKKYSQTYRSNKDYIRNSSKWTTDFLDMALKTVLKLNLSKNAPLSVEVIDAINADQSVMFNSEKEYEYIDNEMSMEEAQRAAELAETFADFDEVVNSEENVKDNNTASDK